MNVLVLNPPNKPFSEKSILIEPIDILTIATYIQNLGHDITVIDMDVKKMLAKDLEIHDNDFDHCIIPFDYHIPLHTTDVVKHIHEISEVLKKKGTNVVLTGKTPSYTLEYMLTKSVDVIIHNQCETKLPKLLEKSIWDEKHLRNIPGISYRNGSSIRRNPTGNDQFDINSLTIPNRKLLNLNDYIDVRTMLTSTGCDGNCIFCPTPDFEGRWKGRNPKLVVNEIRELIEKYDAKKILFLDDNASVDITRMKQISNELISQGIGGNLVSLGLLSSIRSYDRSTFELMYKAGFRWVHFGCESAENVVLRKCKKGIQSDDIKTAVTETKEMGYRVRTSWIFDLPGSDIHALRKTADMIVELEPHEVRAHFLTVRAGTDLYHSTEICELNPSQYIHHKESSYHKRDISSDGISLTVDGLINSLKDKGYSIVTDVTQWQNLEKMKEKNPGMKFISFCPSRYGINWEGQN